MKGLLFILLTLLLTGASAQTIHYVSASAQGQNSGTSWSNAYTNLHDGLMAAQAGDQIWVAKGTYYPSVGTDRAIHFELTSGVKLFGGFAGSESVLSERDWATHPSVIDGDIGLMGDSTDNSYNLLYMESPNEMTLVDGFVFQNGVGNLDMFIYAPGTCGGAIFIDGKNQKAFPLISNCSFIHNTAVFAGGAVYASSTANGSVAPRFLNCLFERNICTNGSGGAYYRTGGCSTEQTGDLMNCKFIENEAPGSGGAVFLGDAARSDTMDIVNCLFEKNFSKGLGGGIFTGGQPNGTYLNMIGSSFNENKAKIASGFCHYSDVNPIRQITFDSCIFEGNNFYITNPLGSYFSAAFSIYSGYYNNGDAEKRLIKISNCQIKNHTDHTMDIVVNHGKISIQKTSFYNINICEINTSDTLLFYRNTFRNNQYPIFLRGNNNINTTYIINNLFEGNHASWGIFGNSLLANVVGNAFVNNVIENPNSGLGSGNIPSLFQNNIFLGNINLLQKTGLSWRIPVTNSTSIFSDNLFDFPTCDSLPSAFTCGGGNKFSANPMFVDPANGDYRLQPCSPAYNAGADLPYQQFGITTDLWGNPRITDGVVDIGPFEIAEFKESTSPIIRPSCESIGSGSVFFHLENGCPPYQFQWSGSNGMGNDTIGLLPGNYIFSITDSQGRMMIDDLVIDTSILPKVEESITDASCQSCSNGAITLTIVDGNAPYGFHWNNDSTTMNLTDLLPGEYTLTITDASGCDFAFDFIVSFGVSTNEQKITGQISLTPNPAGSTIILKTTLPASSLEIFDALGRLVKRQTLKLSTDSSLLQDSVSLEGLVVGQYVIVLYKADGELLTMKKISKQ